MKRIVLVSLALLLSPVGEAYAEELPNIVVFISDDLGRLETSVYGSDQVTTPNMDKLAAAGTRPEFELFDLDADPLELNNLAASPQHRDKLRELQAELADWTSAQGDEQAPHRPPYLTSQPLPLLKPKQRKK